VSDAAVLGVFVPEREPAAAAEVSIASTTPAVGVLVPAVDAALCARVARAWGRAAPPWPAPTFLRCDVDGGAWLAVAWYRDAHADDFESPVGETPVQYVAERWRRDGGDELSLYIQVAGIPPAGLPEAARAMGTLAGLTPVALDVAAQLASSAARLGWTQSYAATVYGPAPRLKLGVATRRVEDALALLPDAGAAAALRTRSRRLRARLAYAGFTIERDGAIGLRLYAQPMRGDQVERTVRAAA